MVQLLVVAQVAELVGRDADLGDMILSMVAPVPTRTCRSSTAIFFLSPVSASSLKMMIFASWPPSSMTDPHVGMELLDRQRDGVDLLHELRADESRDAPTARAGDEDAERGGNWELAPRCA